MGRGADAVPVIVDLLHDKAFCALRRKMDENVLSWDTFVGLDMPEGFSPMETWTVLEAMRHQNARVVKVRSFFYTDGPDDYWYSMSDEMAVLVNELFRMGKGRVLDPWDGSALGENALFLEACACDLCAALNHDGVQIDSTSVADMLADRRGPRNAWERAAANAAGVLRGISRWSKQQISPWMIEALSVRLDEGCDDLERVDPMGRAHDIYPKEPISQYVDDLCAMLETSPTKDRDCITDLVLFSLCMYDLDALSPWSATIEFLIRHIFIRRAGLPSLHYVPLSKLVLDWERGSLPEGDVVLDWDSRNPNCGEGFDCGSYLAQALRLMLRSPRRAEERVLRRGERIDRAGDFIKGDPALNHRQRELLLDLVTRPREVTIAEHMDARKIAYATARADLMSLESLGHLVSERKGRAQRFRLSDALRFKVNAPTE